jgi:hypothetical protein
MDSANQDRLNSGTGSASTGSNIKRALTASGRRPVTRRSNEPACVQAIV